MARAHPRAQRKRSDAAPRGIGGGKGKERPELTIPELEEALVQAGRYRPWTADEIAVLKRYYRPGMCQALVDYFAERFPPGRSTSAIQNQAVNLGLTARRD